MTKIKYLALALSLCAGPTVASTVDPYHGACTPEDALSDPLTWADSKGMRLPPTCLPFVETWDHEIFERAKGAPLTQREKTSLFYRWHRIHEPDRPMFNGGDCDGFSHPVFGCDQPGRPAPDPDKSLAQTPLPAAIVMLLSGLLGLGCFKRRMK